MKLGERCLYRNRKKALDLYLQGARTAVILKATGLNRAAARRLLERCCRINPETGQCYGYKGLLLEAGIRRRRE